MRKVIFSFIIAFILLLTQASGVYAADLAISCDSSSCVPSSSPALFLSTEMWYPGKAVTKTILITNTGSSNHSVGVRAENTSATGSLDTTLQLAIVRQNDSATLWAGTLQNFYTAGEISFSTINSGSNETFNFTISLPTSAGNEFQAKTTVFDLVLGFFPTQTPPNNPDNPNKNDGGNGGSGGGTSNNNAGSVIVAQVLGLVNPSFPFLFREVLGTRDNLNRGISTRSAEVLPLDSSFDSTICEHCIWWPFLLIEAVTLIILIWVGRRRQWGKIHYFVFTIIVGIIIQLAFWWWNRNCPNLAFFCRYFWIFNIIVVLVGNLFFKKHD